jgi:hypothetical protein
MTIKSSRTSPLLTGNIKISGHGATESGEPFVRLDVGGKRVLVRVNNLLLSPNVEFARLQNHGARLLDSAARQELTRRIEVARREPASFNVATTLGWHGEAFVFPDGVVPAGWSDVEIYLEDDGADLYRRFRCCGTRAGTMQLFALFAGNSRLMTGAALAFVGPLSPVIRPEHVALQFVGESGDGKTSGAAAISSIWGGDPDPNHRLGSGTSWKNTDYALEKYAAAHNNMLLFLDEADSAEGEDGKSKSNSLLNAIKDISGGKGKGKGRGNDPDVSTSYTPILSTSNVSVPRMLVLTKRRVDDFAYIDRLLDIPAPAGGHGFFENLHGFSNLAKFRDRLIELACLHYGLAGRAYVWHIAHALRNDRDEFVAFLKERREQYEQAVAHLKAPGRKLLRVHGKFATIYAAGCAAIRFKILPFTEADLLEAVMTCERDHIAFIAKELGGPYALDANPVAAAAPRTAYAALKAYLNGPVAKNFVDLREPAASVPSGHAHASAPGYLGTYRGSKEIWLPYACFERIAGGPAESHALKAELHAKGLIASEGQGKRQYFTVKRDIPGLGRVRVIALRAP